MLFKFGYSLLFIILILKVLNFIQYNMSIQEETNSLLPTEYQLIKWNSTHKLRKNQKKDMILVNGSFFKQMPDEYVYYYKAKYETTENVFICSHSHTSCKCRVILLSNGCVITEGVHVVDIYHFNDMFKVFGSPEPFFQKGFWENPNERLTYESD